MNNKKKEQVALIKTQKTLAQTLALLRRIYFLQADLTPEVKSILADGFNAVGSLDNVANVVDGLEWKVWSLLQKTVSRDSVSN
jgi:hypothetical protein